MKILHICNDFCGSKVHSNLYRELDKLGIKQTVFTCYRGNYPEGTNQYDGKHSDFIYRGILTTKYRFFFHSKIKRVYKELKNSVNLPNYDLVHAVTMFTDGAVAYKLYREYGVPYIISVRNTDINEFLMLAPHTWITGMNILLHAQKIVFISKAPMEKFCRHLLVKGIFSRIKDRMIVQPNGVDDFWLNHKFSGSIKRNHDIIYVGKFDRNKNVIRLIEAVLALKKEFKDIKLHLVGGGGSRELKIKEMVKANQDCLIYHGKIYDKDKLKEIYAQCSIFAMPSIHETFGLVYIEAMSQNLAVLFTKHQGIDGLFDSRIGESVNALSVVGIKNGLYKMLINRQYYDFMNSVDFERFRWGEISEIYKDIYEQCIIK